MDDKYTLIPRNVVGKSEKFPVEFLVHLDVEKRQIPYIAIGGSVSALFIINPALGTIYKLVIPVISVGVSALTSVVKIEGQHVENMIINYIKQVHFSKQIRRRLNGNENFTTRFSKFTIQKIRNKTANN